MSFEPNPFKLAYSIKEACRASSLGRTTLYALIKAGELETTKVGGRTVIPAQSLRSLLAAECIHSSNDGE